MSVASGSTKTAGPSQRQSREKRTAVCAIAVHGAVTLARQSRIVPYIVEVDRLGQPLAYGRVEDMPPRVDWKAGTRPKSSPVRMARPIVNAITRGSTPTSPSRGICSAGNPKWALIARRARRSGDRFVRRSVSVFPCATIPLAR